MIKNKTKISYKEFKQISKQYNKPDYFYQKDDKNNKIILTMEFDQANKKQANQPNTNNVSNLTPEFFENLFNNVLDQRFGKNNYLLLDEIDKRIDKKIDTKINVLEQKINKRFDAFETKVDQRFDKIEKDIEMLKSFHKDDIEKYKKNKK